jgi:hypothetical protein
MHIIDLHSLLNLIFILLQRNICFNTILIRLLFRLNYNKLKNCHPKLINMPFLHKSYFYLI